jgi:hypothetical protein
LWFWAFFRRKNKPNLFVLRAALCVMRIGFEKTKHVLSEVEWANFQSLPFNSEHCIDRNNDEPVQIVKGIIILIILFSRRHPLSGKLLETPAKYRN